ncbi:DUF5327 family protein [Alkalihalobacterium chitinilyticum]|uniref:YwdI family protein n=1 Tax=Alkalihalobacterium chitinilyticum TaxID=2980103 RepID=A0ABT5VGQ0_9BACI|nr:DUF5327 family protein [Alkalihalobacterium chitinilyticum]MDE5414638.1 YwdI family protein [Alkalihalobacterium chitinilyticum]
MNIPVQNIIAKVEQQLNEMKSEAAEGNERGVQEAAKLIKAYCELVLDKESTATKKTTVSEQPRILPSANVTTPSTSSLNSNKDEGSLLDF